MTILSNPELVDKRFDGPAVSVMIGEDLYWVPTSDEVLDAMSLPYYVLIPFYQTVRDLMGF